MKKFFSVFLLILACCFIVQAQGTGSATNKISSGGSSVAVDSTGVRITPRAGTGISVTSSCAGATVSALGEAKYCYNNADRTIRASINGGAYFTWATASGVAGVSSVDATVPSILTVSGVPVTSTGTIAIDLATETANAVLAGPTTGSAAKPTFRALVPADVPVLDTGKITTGVFAPARILATPYALGDIVYAPTTTTLGRLPGNNTATRKFLASEGNGTNVTSISYAVIRSADLPEINLASGGAGGITGVLGISHGGLNLSAIGDPRTMLGVNAAGTAYVFRTIQAGSGFLTVSVDDSTITLDAPSTSRLWNNIGSPTGDFSLSMGDNLTLFTWPAFASSNMFTVQDTTGATGGVYIFSTLAKSGSNNKPFRALANTNGWEVTTTGLLNAVGTAGLTTTSTITSGGNVIADADGTRSIGLSSSGRFNVFAYGISVARTTAPTPGQVEVGSGANIIQIGNGPTVGVRLGGSVGINFADNPETTAPSVGLWYDSPGVIQVNNASGTPGTLQDLRLRNLLFSDGSTQSTAGANFSSSTDNALQKKSGTTLVDSRITDNGSAITTSGGAGSINLATNDIQFHLTAGAGVELDTTLPTTFGDASGNGNGTKIIVTDSAENIDLQASEIRANGSTLYLTAPVSITSGFGISPAIEGVASSFKVTVGTGGAASGVVAFNGSFTHAPPCMANDETSNILVRAISTTTGVTLQGAMVGGDVIKVVCTGY